MTREQALERLAQVAAEAARGVLSQTVSDEVEMSKPLVLPEGSSPLAGIALPSVVCSIEYVGAISGETMFVADAKAARALSGAMGAEASGGEDEIPEIVPSAIGELMNQLMVPVSSELTKLLATDTIDIGPPNARIISSEAEIAELASSSRVTTVGLSVKGGNCRFAQIVPSALLVRMTRVFSNITKEITSEHKHGDEPTLGADALRDINVRVAVEMGRARLPLGRAVELPPGSLIALDREVNDPVDLYVNGKPFARGELVVTDSEEWAVQISTILSPEEVRVAVLGE